VTRQPSTTTSFATKTPSAPLYDSTSNATGYVDGYPSHPADPAYVNYDATQSDQAWPGQTGGDVEMQSVAHVPDPFAESRQPYYPALDEVPAQTFGLPPQDMYAADQPTSTPHAWDDQAQAYPSWAATDGRADEAGYIEVGPGSDGDSVPPTNG
jgi:hypothetical protein